MSEVESKNNEEEVHERPTVVRNATDLQRLKLEKLMKHPEKPIIIAEKPKERGMPAVPEFVRNVMGSSAGAGSGEFHVYRHLRRKEYARQKFMKERGERERLEDEYHEKLEDNKKKADEKTAKKRAKRLKKKGKMKRQKKTSKNDKNLSESEEEEEPSSESEAEKAAENVNETQKDDSQVDNEQENNTAKIKAPTAIKESDESNLIEENRNSSG